VVGIAAVSVAPENEVQHRLRSHTLERMRALSTRRPPLLLGVVAACGLIGLETLLLYPLGEVAPSVSLGVVFLVGVLIVAIVWGAWLGVATSLVSAAAFNFFHIPPTGEFTIAEAENWVALVVFLITAVVAAGLAEAARHRAQEAEQRGREADLAAELARVLLGAADLSSALGPAAQRIAQALGLRSARIVLEAVGDDARSAAVPLMRGDERLGTLLVPRDAREAGEALRPALEALLAAALEREALTREVVETRALRRSDEIKTAVLRAVSHDLRSPITAIAASVEALASPALRDDERQELSAGVAAESARLGRLVDKLLELSRLQAGAAEPHRDWCSVEELLREAAASAGLAADGVKLVIDRELPLIHADAGQLERAFANLLENAAGHSGGKPVSVRARVSGGRLLVRIVDRGPGIAPADQDRIFEPFFRAGRGRGPGSGLGLAIVKGFVEANGGRVHVESLPGQGASFVVALPLPERAPAGVKA
jgi:two-component system, OmpR family, sensor histidine kinase KdpD